MANTEIRATERSRGAASLKGRSGNSSAKRRARRETITALLFLAPSAVGLILFMITPFFMAFYLSLTDTRLMSPNPPEIIGLENYKNLLSLKFIPMTPMVDEATGEVQLDEEGNVAYPRSRTILRGDERYRGMKELMQFDLTGKRYLVAAGDPTFWKGLSNNFKFVLVVVPLQTAFALLLALLVNQKMPGSNIYRALYFTPVVTSMVVVSVIWFFLFNPGQGTINAFIETVTFGLVGPQDWLADPKLAFPSIMVMSIWQGVGFQMVIFLAGLQEIPPEIYEAAAIDGCNKLQEFFFVTLPQLRTTTIFVVIATTILAFQLFTQVDVMTGGGPSEATMTTILHVVNEGRRQLRAGYASAITVVFFLIVLVISIIQRFVIQEERSVE
jgi:multiple sugar transport system permease protein